ncbi:hypothetical protein BDV25DRAFT_151230 [Aspergillus avenaceus]|uniref:Uncharacterized protein n=1 Tax=Aspergillus avenaceus TaxID=36643 RepID=A0A5N6U2C1_ASPAV|nr:hypothetical protein BDV25DRAFT_151230 [Aspergillus avenaceus]
MSYSTLARQVVVIRKRHLHLVAFVRWSSQAPFEPHGECKPWVIRTMRGIFSCRGRIKHTMLHDLVTRLLLSVCSFVSSSRQYILRIGPVSFVLAMIRLVMAWYPLG